MIGRYTLLEEIGTGGFGAVFLAEQREPVVRRVALKVIKLGMDTEQVIARFEQERQALALMDHPNIARVLDAGATEGGRLYFVMELVAGQRITHFSDAHRLTVRQRLELFVQVCNAIQHAHQKGIIHRDIKPSNVLVSLHDGKPVAKVIDFGVAKATQHGHAPETGVTQLGQFIGTPLYMSPEQSGGSADIDTRTDVYSLGVLLYELLTGTTPFERSSSEAASFAELQRAVREVDPPRPSTRVSAATQNQPLIAERRQAEPARLRSLLRGDLDWIVLRALEKEPARRYQTANGLAMDIERYLAGEPVLAAPPSTVYRARKFINRHRAAVLAAAAVALALVAGLASTLWLARVAAAERDLARQQAARATALNEFMTQMLTASDPELQGSREVTVLELLDKASHTAGRTLAGTPLAEAEARTLLGSTFRSLGKVDQAVAELERAVTLRAQVAGADVLGHSRSLRALALTHRDRGNFEQALDLYRQAESLVSAEGESQLEERLVVAFELGQTLVRASRYEEANRNFDQSELLLPRLPGEQHAKRCLILLERTNLEEVWRADLERAERVATAALAHCRQAAEPWLVSDGLNNLAVIKNSRNQLDESAALHEEGIAIVREIYGERSPVLAVRLENLGNVYMKRGELERTLELLGQVLSIREEVYGADSFPAARTRFNMGAVALQANNYARALPLIDSALPVFRAHAGERSLEASIGQNYRGRAHEGLGDLLAAERDYRDALTIADGLGAPTSATRLNALLNLTRLHCRQGRVAAAESALGLAERALAARSPDLEPWITRFEEVRAGCPGLPRAGGRAGERG